MESLSARDGPENLFSLTLRNYITTKVSSPFKEKGSSPFRELVSTYFWELYYFSHFQRAGVTASSSYKEDVYNHIHVVDIESRQYPDNSCRSIFDDCLDINNMSNLKFLEEKIHILSFSDLLNNEFWIEDLGGSSLLHNDFYLLEYTSSFIRAGWNSRFGCFYIPAYFISSEYNSSASGFYFWFNDVLYYYSASDLNCFKHLEFNRLVSIFSLLNIDNSDQGKSVVANYDIIL